LQDRFGGSKFVASGSTAALDNVLLAKYEKTEQLLKKNMEVIKRARSVIKGEDFSSQGEGKTTVSFSAKVTEEKCNGCKICLTACPEPNVIKFLKDIKKVQVNENRCKGCELCIAICPKGALAVGSL